MGYYFSQILLASRKVLRDKLHLILFILLIPLTAYLLILIPVNTIPGNSLSFQLRLMNYTEYISIAFVVFLESLLIVMMIYALRLQLKRNHLTTAGQGSFGLLSGVPAFLFGTKLCPICLSAVFGTLGISTTFILPILQYGLWFFTFSILILLFSVYSVSKKINDYGNNGRCEKCR